MEAAGIVHREDGLLFKRTELRHDKLDLRVKPREPAARKRFRLLRRVRLFRSRPQLKRSSCVRTHKRFFPIHRDICSCMHSSHRGTEKRRIECIQVCCTKDPGVPSSIEGHPKSARCTCFRSAIESQTNTGSSCSLRLLHPSKRPLGER